MDVEPVLMAEPDPSSADSLVSTNGSDDLANEQTWPTEEEMSVVQENVEEDMPEAVEGTTPKRVRRIPKGMSEYQAAWIIDDEEGEDAEGEGIVEDAGIKGDQEEEEAEEMQDLTLDEAQTDLERRENNHFQDLDIDEEAKQYVISLGLSEPNLTDGLQPDWTLGGTVDERKKMTWLSQTKWTLPKIYLLEYVFNDIEV